VPEYGCRCRKANRLVCAGACAIDGAVALSLERLVGIDEVDPSSATITVRAGTPLQAVQQAADAAFLLPVDRGAAPARSAATRPMPVATA
jgi:FAD/FMN-containing dehydrogenase